MACHDIGEKMITRDPDMTRLLDKLEDRDLLLPVAPKAGPARHSHPHQSGRA